MKNNSFHYHVELDFCISDLDYCGEGRTIDISVYDLYKDKKMLKRMKFDKNVISSLDNFLNFLATIHGSKDLFFDQRIKKLYKNPTVRILDSSKTQKILKTELRRKKLTQIKQIFK